MTKQITLPQKSHLGLQQTHNCHHQLLGDENPFPLTETDPFPPPKLGLIHVDTPLLEYLTKDPKVGATHQTKEAAVTIGLTNINKTIGITGQTIGQTIDHPTGQEATRETEPATIGPTAGTATQTGVTANPGNTNSNATAAQVHVEQPTVTIGAEALTEGIQKWLSTPKTSQLMTEIEPDNAHHHLKSL